MRWRSALTGNRLTPTTLRSGVGFGSLAANWQPSTMALPAVALYIDQATDIHLVLSTKVSLDGDTGAVDAGPDVGEFLPAQVAHPGARADAEIRRYVGRTFCADAVYRCETDDDAEIVWDVYACDDCHVGYSSDLTLPLLEARVLLVDDVDAAFAADDAATRLFRFN